MADCGDWELLAARTKLVGGKVPFSADTWHNLRLAFLDNKISVVIDGAPVARIEDNSVDHGNAGIGSGWHRAQVANIAIHSQALLEDLARGKPATASASGVRSIVPPGPMMGISARTGTRPKARLPGSGWKSTLAGPPDSIAP